MNRIIAVWTQSLDNSSHDSMILDDSILSDNEVKKRNIVSSYINQILSDSKSFIVNNDNIKLTLCGGQFVIEIPSVEKDNLGRLSPILFYGKYDKNFIENNDIEKHFIKLINMIGRSVDEVILKDSNYLIKEYIINEIKKKNMKMNLIGLSAGIIAMLLVPFPAIGKVLIGSMVGICVKLLLTTKEEK